MKESTHKREEMKNVGVLEALLSDVIGPIQSLSLGDSRYILTILGESSGASWVKSMENKDGTPDHIINMILFALILTRKKGEILQNRWRWRIYIWENEKALGSLGIEPILKLP